MRGKEVNSSEKPVMVLRYNRWRTAAFVLYFGIFFVLFLFMFLFVVTPEKTDSIYEYWFYKSLTLFFTLIALWCIIDPLNTDRIEVYRDKIVKVRKIELPLPFFCSRVIKYDKASFDATYSGIYFIEVGERKRFFSNAKYAMIHTDILSKEDRERLAKFLSEISGWPEDEFQSKFISTEKKFFKRSKK